MLYSPFMYRLMHILPVSTGSAIGAWLGGMVGPRRMAVRSERARRNLALLRPDLSEGDVAALLHERWRNVGRFAAELPSMGRLLANGHFSIEDHDAYRAIVDGPGAIIFVSLHIGHWDVIAAHLKTQMDRPSIGVQQPPENPRHAKMLEKARAAYATDALPPGEGAARRILRHLAKEDRALAYMLLDERRDRQVSFPTFGRPLGPQGNVSIALRMAKASGARIMPLYLVRTGSTHFTLKWHQPFDPADMDQAAIFAALDDFLGDAALAHLDQWLGLQDIDLTEPGHAPAPTRM
jgi:KDO2-lipid IV(A) lauroyltransferase